MLLSTVKKVYKRSGKNLIWSIKIRYIKLKILTRPFCLQMIFLLLTLLYLIILFKINLLVFLKEPSKDKAFLTLHVTTEMHFSLRKSLKNTMHGLVIMYVMLFFVCLFCCFTSQVNSYGHCGTVSSPNHTFSWASLNKQLTSTSCTYFHL